LIERHVCTNSIVVTKQERRFVSPLLLAVLTAAVFSCGLAATSASAQIKTLREGDKVDAVVAVVGRYPIYKSSIDGKIQIFLMQRNATHISDDTLKQLRKQLLDAEIDEKVMLAKADQDSINVTEAEVDDRMEQQIRLYVRQLGSEANVEKQFGRSVAELKSSPELRQRARESLMIEQERYRSIPASTSISRHDVEEFYHLYKDSLPSISAEVDLSTIMKFVKPQPNQKDRSKKFALSLLDSLQNGVDFATLARRYSQHSTAKNGGDLGDFYPRGTFLPEFEEAAFKLKPNEVSKVIETDQGFHIIKLIERRGEEIHVAQILIKPNANSADEEVARNELLALKARAEKGEDFGKLATESSDDPETKATGGMLGRLRVEDLAPEQREVVDSLKAGEISRPLHIALSKTLTGYQIVRLNARIPPHPVSLTQDYREIEATAMQWKQNRDLQKFIADARATVYIQSGDIESFY
jgi:peptidyl-prolyl cis-trans isomerase SurA